MKIKLKIICPVPSFVCPIRSLKVGPFDKGEIVNLPEPVANLLIRKKRATEIKEQEEENDKSNGIN